MTCKDCIHHNLCDANECLQVVTDIIDDSINYIYLENVQNRCAFFKNKADVVEVKHGEWIKSIHKETPIIKDGRLFEKEHEVFCCSVCDVKIVGLRNMSFCPFCGAKMDGERKCENG